MRRAIPVLPMLVVSIIASAGGFVVSASKGPRPGAPEVVVHEWGTFTTVAGEDGQAINWLPLGGPSDLPCFVERYKNKLFKFVGNAAEQEGPVDYATARSSLVGTVRMETPVLYFYSPEEAIVSVSVRFPRGLMTEWFPKAVVNQPNVVPNVLDDPKLVGGLDWPYVQILPARKGEFPQGGGKSHYYAARATDSAPLYASGQFEKFLFYRGVASFPPVLSAKLGDDGSVFVTNLGKRPIPQALLFENRAGIMSFRPAGALEGSRRLARPEAHATAGGLHTELLKMLVNAGLYAKEAEAMIATWGDSWFEEGTRVFYVVPAASVDDILPLNVTPAPAAVARVFVGRMEVITPEALVRAQTALAQGDDAALERQGRFLGAVADRLIARTSSVSERNRIRAVSNTVFASYVRRMGECQ